MASLSGMSIIYAGDTGLPRKLRQLGDDERIGLARDFPQFLIGQVVQGMRRNDERQIGYAQMLGCAYRMLQKR